MVKIDCICPPNAHGEVRHPAGDKVELRERLDFRSALTARREVVYLKTEDPDASLAEVLATLTETYLLLGITSWTIVDAKNKPVEVSRLAIRELLAAHPEEAMVIGDAADELYSAAVILPLLTRAQTSSPPTPTDESTSATTTSTTRRPRRSKPSSITTIPMAATVTTSALPDGDSSSSPNLTSAG